MAGRDREQSAAEKAYGIICEKILGGDLEPGARLTRRDMASLTGVSIIPVIEALHKLENEGLVESTPYYGSSVIKLTAETIRDRYALRLATESQVARMLSRGLRLETRDRLVKQAEHLDSETQAQGRVKSTWEHNYNFHVGLAELTECQSLVDAMHRMHLFRLLQWKKLIHWESQDTATDPDANSHVWLLGEIFAGEPSRAEVAARRHIAAAGQLPPELVDWIRS